jgi:hypothetical protein
MLIAAFVILSTAVLLGTVLAILHFRSQGAVAPAWPFAGIHGLLAIGGFGCLLLGLRGPPRGLATGTGSFGTISAALVGLAALFGAGMLATRLINRRVPGIIVGVHATFAVSGFVFLATYILMG